MDGITEITDNNENHSSKSQITITNSDLLTSDKLGKGNVSITSISWHETSIVTLSYCTLYGV